MGVQGWVCIDGCARLSAWAQVYKGECAAAGLQGWLCKASCASTEACSCVHAGLQLQHGCTDPTASQPHCSAAFPICRCLCFPFTAPFCRPPPFCPPLFAPSSCPPPFLPPLSAPPPSCSVQDSHAGNPQTNATSPSSATAAPGAAPPTPSCGTGSPAPTGGGAAPGGSAAPMRGNASSCWAQVRHRGHGGGLGGGSVQWGWAHFVCVPPVPPPCRCCSRLPLLHGCSECTRG